MGHRRRRPRARPRRGTGRVRRCISRPPRRPARHGPPAAISSRTAEEDTAILSIFSSHPRSGAGSPSPSARRGGWHERQQRLVYIPRSSSSRSATARLREIQQPRRFAPARQRARGVRSHDQRQLGVGMRRHGWPARYRPYRTFPPVRSPAQTPADRAPRRPPDAHRHAMLSAGIIAPRPACSGAMLRRHQQHPLQAQLCARVPCERDMAEVGRVERPTEDAHRSQTGGHRRSRVSHGRVRRL